MKKQPESLKRRLKGLTISAAIIAAILIGSTFYFQNIKGSYEKKMESIRETYLSLSKNAEVIEETKKLRADFYKRRHYLDFPLKYSYSAANFVRELSLIAAAAIELIEIEIDPVDQGLTFSLRGQIKAGNIIDARSKSREFFQALEQFEDILHIEPSKVNSRPAEKKTGPGKKPVEFYFTIDGEVETW
jgi:hypothetical protein